MKSGYILYGISICQIKECINAYSALLEVDPYYNYCPHCYILGLEQYEMKQQFQCTRVLATNVRSATLVSVRKKMRAVKTTEKKDGVNHVKRYVRLLVTRTLIPSPLFWLVAEKKPRKDTFAVCVSLKMASFWLTEIQTVSCLCIS